MTEKAMTTLSDTPGEGLAPISRAQIDAARDKLTEIRGITVTRSVMLQVLQAAEALAALSRAPEATGEFFIQERDDDMLIAEKGWHFNRCIARRPKLLTNDEWRPTAQRIVAALATPPAPQPALALVEELTGHWRTPKKRYALSKSRRSLTRSTATK